MPEADTLDAATLRQRFREIPKADRDAHQPFSIRVWRGVSWLERSENVVDLEGRFIFLWIAFNASDGYLEDDGRDAGDRASWQTFLGRMVRRDAGGALDRVVRKPGTARSGTSTGSATSRGTPMSRTIRLPCDSISRQIPPITCHPSPCLHRRPGRLVPYRRLPCPTRSQSGWRAFSRKVDRCSSGRHE